MTTPAQPQPPADENSLIAERRSKLASLRGQGVAFPNDFRRTDHAGDLQYAYADAEAWSAEADLTDVIGLAVVVAVVLLQRAAAKREAVQ